MTSYECKKCNKIFKNKTVYERHRNMKKDCSLSKKNIEDDIVKTYNEITKTDKEITKTDNKITKTYIEFTKTDNKIIKTNKEIVKFEKEIVNTDNEITKTNAELTNELQQLKKEFDMLKQNLFIINTKGVINKHSYNLYLFKPECDNFEQAKDKLAQQILNGDFKRIRQYLVEEKEREFENETK